MIDNVTWLGVPYRLRYHRGKMLEELLGDFYCLGPGVSLNVEDIKQCLLTIDAWPIEPNRFLPSSNSLAVACEQMATALLLARFESVQLPIDGYSAIGNTPYVPFHDAREALHSYRALFSDKEWPPALKEAFYARIGGSIRHLIADNGWAGPKEIAASPA